MIARAVGAPEYHLSGTRTRERPRRRVRPGPRRALAFGTALSGCVVAALGAPRACVGVGVVAPAPLVVVGGGYYRRG